MNPATTSARAGLQRGWIEFRQVATTPSEAFGWLWIPIVALVVMFLLRDNTVPGTSFSLGAQAIPGILAMNLVFTALMGMAVALASDRESGMLLRAKATPNGMLGYLIGKVASQSGLTASMLAVVLVPAAFLFDGLRLGSAGAWLTLLWVLPLGLAATLPIGALIGASFRSTQSLGMVSLPLMGLIAISGVFYPITALATWLQWVAQVFPLYWLGLGLRSAMLPDELAVAELGESWRTLETVGVLGAWTLLGFLVAPMMLRRLARR